MIILDEREKVLKRREFSAVVCISRVFFLVGVAFRVFEAVTLGLIQIIVPGFLLHFLFLFLRLLSSDPTVEIIHYPLSGSLLAFKMLFFKLTDLLSVDLELLLLGDDLVVLLSHLVVFILFDFLLFVELGLVTSAVHFVEDARHGDGATEQNHGHLKCRIVFELVHDEASAKKIHEDNTALVEGHRLELGVEADDAVEVHEVVDDGEACDCGKDVARRVHDQLEHVLLCEKSHENLSAGYRYAAQHPRESTTKQHVKSEPEMDREGLLHVGIEALIDSELLDRVSLDDFYHYPIAGFVESDDILPDVVIMNILDRGPQLGAQLLFLNEPLQEWLSEGMDRKQTVLLVLDGGKISVVL